MMNLSEKVEYIKESLRKKMESDARGYSIGEFVYHVAPINRLNSIERKGFTPQDGVSINGKKFYNRVYFATSLIAAYDLSVNFGSYKDDSDYVIFKVDSKGLSKGYSNDPLFLHGVYIDYKVPAGYIFEVIKADSLFNQFEDEDLENLY